jgi:hypothetical protein
VNPLTRREMIKGSIAAVAVAFAQNPLSLFGGGEGGRAKPRSRFWMPNP